MLIKQERDNFWILNWLDEFMMGHKGFICGGCFKNIFCNEKVKDLDIFFETRNDFNYAVEYFDSMTTGFEGKDKRTEEYSFYYENENVKAYKHIRTGVVLELNCKIFGNAESILNQFDFTIVKFAYYKEDVVDENQLFEEDVTTHVEYKVLHDEKFFEHLHMKRLVVNDKIPYPMVTFERMFRYAKYGYFPCKDTKVIVAEAIRELSREEIRVPNSLYNGMD